MATKKKAVRQKKEKPLENFYRELSEAEFEIRDLMWAAAINCVCGYQHDIFIRYIEPEMKCPKCGRQYEVKLKAYEVEKLPV